MWKNNYLHTLYLHKTTFILPFVKKKKWYRLPSDESSDTCGGCRAKRNLPFPQWGPISLKVKPFRVGQTVRKPKMFS